MPKDQIKAQKFYIHPTVYIHLYRYIQFNRDPKDWVCVCVCVCVCDPKDPKDWVGLEDQILCNMRALRGIFVVQQLPLQLPLIGSSACAKLSLCSHDLKLFSEKLLLEICVCRHWGTEDTKR